MKRINYKVMHVVEAFGGGVGHSIKQIYTNYAEDLEGIVVHGERDLNISLFKDSEHVFFQKWNVGREISVRDINSYFELVEIIRAHQPDLIHCHSAKSGVLGRLAAKKFDIPCVYTPHSYSFLRTDVTRFKAFLFKKIERMLSSTAVTIACGLEEYAEAIKLKGSVEVVENGVDTTRFYPKDNYENESGFSVTSVGRICPQKDFEFFKSLANDERLKDVTFNWVSGEDNECIQDLPKNIRLYGRLSPEKVADLLRESNAYINTALWEGLSRSVLEGMASGLPLLLRDSPGNREVVFRPAVAHEFNSIETAVNEIIKVRDICKSNSAYGRKNFDIAKRFYSAEKTQSRIRSIYDALVFSKMLGGK